MKFDDTVPYATVLTFHSPVQDQRLSSVVHRSGSGYTASQIFLLLPQIQCLSHPVAYVPASPSGKPVLYNMQGFINASVFGSIEFSR